jgi:hypothetical protein
MIVICQWSKEGASRTLAFWCFVDAAACFDECLQLQMSFVVTITQSKVMQIQRTPARSDMLIDPYAQPSLSHSWLYILAKMGEFLNLLGLV